MFAVRGACSKFVANDGLFLSAGLAFFFLVTMIPLAMVGVSIIGFVMSSEQAATAIVDQLARNFPVYRREIRTVLLRIVETRAVSGGLGTVILVMSSTPLFSSARLVLHRMLGIRTARGWVRHFLLDAGMVLIFAVMLLRTNSSAPLGPGSAPLIRRRFFSASTPTSGWLRVVT